MAKVTYEFDYYEERELIEMHTNVTQMYSALFDIYNMVRSELKHGDEELSPHIDRLLEDIKDLAGIATNY